MKTKTIQVTQLTLDEEEREWLKGLVQNPINHRDGNNAYNESEQDAKMRMKFFKACGGSVV